MCVEGCRVEACGVRVPACAARSLSEPSSAARDRVAAVALIGSARAPRDPPRPANLTAHATLGLAPLARVAASPAPPAPHTMDAGNAGNAGERQQDDRLIDDLPNDVFIVNGKTPSPEEIVEAKSRLARRLAALSSGGASRHAPRHGAIRHGHKASEEHLDVLARATASFRALLHRAGDALEACQRSHAFSVLSRTTQPAHLITFVSVALLAMLLFPRHAPTAPTAPTAAGSVPGRAPGRASWAHLAYIVAFAAHFGSQFWMTFVSGLSLFFSLPRHHFAEVQKVLFPLYFAINASLSLLTLAAFLRLSSAWDAEELVQVSSMALCFMLELLARLYLTPPLLRLITAKTEMEKSVEGVGQEVGRYDLGPLTQCPHYVRVHRAFRKVHASIALANIVTMGCTALHAHYLAGKVCL